MTIIRSAADLPNLQSKQIVLDFETSSGNKKKTSVNPWFNCRVAGTGVKPADGPGFYIPTGHILDDSVDGLQNRAPNQIDEAIAAKWLYDTLSGCETIVGQNIKYDCHVLANNWNKYTPDGEGFTRLLLQKNWIDTLTHAKLVDSDRWSYGLKKLSVDWLGHEDHSDPLKPYLKDKNGRSINQDFGQIPVDVCGTYCIEDLNTTEELENYCNANMESCASKVWNIERQLTQILWCIERTGMRIDVSRLELTYIAVGQRLVRLQEELCSILAADKCSPHYIRPAENIDCYEVLCLHYGLPVLEWTEGGKGGKNKKPSFNKHALKQYLFHPECKSTILDSDRERITSSGGGSIEIDHLEGNTLRRIVTKIMDFRKWTTINDMFLVPYQELHIEGLLHGDFDQCIRTGRMAMRRPNMQQVPSAVRKLIVPYDQDYEFARAAGLKNTVGGIQSNETLIARDASQIEFRIITHYCRNPRALSAYNNDPATDYHQFVADDCQIERSPAKNINFMLSFGGGKYKTLHMLKDALDLLGEYGEHAKSEYEGRILVVPEVKWKGRVIQKRMELEGFDAFCWVRAGEVYDNYHRRFPEVKRTSWKAQDVLKSRGWVKNLFGRVRKLPTWAAHKTFNNLVQSSAADLFKERVVALWTAVDFYKGYGTHSDKPKLVGLVHDEIVTSEPNDCLIGSAAMDVLQRVDGTHIDVPITWSQEEGKMHWGECK